MYKFTITTDRAIVVATIDADSAEKTTEVDYQETLTTPNTPSILPELHQYIADRGGLYGGISPIACRANDLRHALGTGYKTATSYDPGFAFEVMVEGDFDPPEPLPDGVIR